VDSYEFLPPELLLRLESEGSSSTQDRAGQQIEQDLLGSAMGA